jgi:hypothetical protein
MWGLWGCGNNLDFLDFGPASLNKVRSWSIQNNYEDRDRNRILGPRVPTRLGYDKSAIDLGGLHVLLP